MAKRVIDLVGKRDAAYGRCCQELRGQTIDVLDDYKHRDGGFGSVSFYYIRDGKPDTSFRHFFYSVRLRKINKRGVTR